MYSENQLLLNKHFLIYETKHHELEHFCGTILPIEHHYLIQPNTFVYVYGDINTMIEEMVESIRDCKVYIIDELSYNNNTDYEIITIGKVPIHIHNIGIYFRNFFDTKDYFQSIHSEHNFYVLTESNKPGNSYRKGVYLTNVDKNNDNEYTYHLLRCSSNLDGATENFRQTDYEIIEQLNDISNQFFSEQVEFNHVLAQVYTNKTENNKQKKAKIKKHSDKTKDMSENGLMAFCTFYDNLNPKQKTDFDYQYKNQSVLTKLRFQLKPSVQDESLTKEFDILLYPNSVFIMSLFTNRLYTHEIIPPTLNIEHLPTRMGYVVRCSNTISVYKNDTPYIEYNGVLKEMHPMTEEEYKHLRDLYYQENTTTNQIQYPEFLSSMNLGDYKQPIY
jgi:hypothetical protein